MENNEEEIVTYHAKGNLPLYDLPFDIVVGVSMKECIAHSKQLFPGANFSRASDKSSYSCKMTHPEMDTKYMFLVDTTDEHELALRIAGEAVEMSWYFVEELDLECTASKHLSQRVIVQALFEQVTNVLGTFLNKVREDNGDMGDL